MTRQATKALGNRYCQARLEAAKYNPRLSSRATAAEELAGITEDSLKRYELDIVKPPNDVIALMADAYNAPELRAWYCANECPLGRDSREIDAMPPERVLIRLRNSMAELDSAISSLSQIMDDGHIDDYERGELPGLRERFLEFRRRIDESLAAIDKAARRGIL